MRCTRRIAAVLGLLAAAFAIGQISDASLTSAPAHTVSLASPASPVIDWP
ncbi:MULTISPECIES: hypothetical protein [unclassified Streptomyces]|nr:hypothetical protein [Streptomyces sp. A1136]